MLQPWKQTGHVKDDRFIVNSIIFYIYFRLLLDVTKVVYDMQNIFYTL